jgi:dipeptide/tripeptide permease
MSQRSLFVKEASVASVVSHETSKRSLLLNRSVWKQEVPTKEEATVLPTNVSSTDEVQELPDEYRSGDARRPLKTSDAQTGEEHRYALRPLVFGASFVLLLHLAECFSYFGIEGIIAPFLVGQYDENWNANLTSVEASSYVSGVAAIAATAPFVGGALADGLLGDYWTLMLGTGVFYVPGLIVLALTTIPYLLSPTFSYAALTSALLVLCPIGTGLVRPITNVFGAKQFHPILQSSKLESYYIYYYQMINVGALGGGILVPLVAQLSDTAAFLAPAGLIALALLVFALGSSRYVKVTPRRDALAKTLQVIGDGCCCLRNHRFPKSRRSVRAARQLFRVVIVSALKLPFDLAFCQMTTVFLVQAMAMRPVGFIDAAMMLNFNAICGILGGVVLSSWLYPVLQRRGVKLAVTHKYAIGTLLGAGSIASAIAVDYAIHRAIDSGGPQVSILWQAFNYALIGIGELFVVTTSFEAGYVIAPHDQKGLASAINQFIMSGLPNFVSIGLYNALSFWLPSKNGNPADSYAESKVYKYLWILLAIMISGVMLSVLPPITLWVERVYQEALDAEAQGGDKCWGDDDYETEIMFGPDDTSSSSGSESDHDSHSGGAARPAFESGHDESYLISPDRNNSILDLEMQLLYLQEAAVSVCDSDEHSYQGPGDDLSLVELKEPSSDIDAGGVDSSSTRCDCASVSSLIVVDDDPHNDFDPSDSYWDSAPVSSNVFGLHENEEQLFHWDCEPSIATSV